MRNIDLKIDNDLKKYLQDAVDLDPKVGLEIALVKDQLNGEGPAVWAMGIVTLDQARDIEKSHESYVTADGMVLLITHPELADELNGKYMDWNDTGVQLIDRD